MLNRMILHGAKRVIVFVVMGAVALWLLLSVIAGWANGCAGPPSLTDAPWAVQTSSRVYYTGDYFLQDGVPAIKNYWVSDDGKSYRFVKDVKLFPSKLYGKIAVVRRSG